MPSFSNLIPPEMFCPKCGQLAPPKADPHHCPDAIKATFAIPTNPYNTQRLPDPVKVTLFTRIKAFFGFGNRGEKHKEKKKKDVPAKNMEDSAEEIREKGGLGIGRGL
jgi:hypothetical protein